MTPGFSRGPVNYLSVEDIDWHIAKVKELGGSILQDKTPVPRVIETLGFVPSRKT